jgi:hypothetical protein
LSPLQLRHLTVAPLSLVCSRRRCPEHVTSPVPSPSVLRSLYPRPLLRRDSPTNLSAHTLVFGSLHHVASLFMTTPCNQDSIYLARRLMPVDVGCLAGAERDVLDSLPASSAAYFADHSQHQLAEAYISTTGSSYFRRLSILALPCALQSGVPEYRCSDKH